jgi:hypothetical protein
MGKRGKGCSILRLERRKKSEEYSRKRRKEDI